MDATIRVQQSEEWATALGGAALLVWGAKRLTNERHRFAALIPALSAGLGWRSAGDDTRARLGGARGTIVEESFAINRSASELYRFWRELEWLPAVMPELSSVRVVNDRQSHWVASGPAGWRAEWCADIINDIPNELIAWRTAEGSDIGTAGSVHFEEGPRGRNTIVRIKLQYDLPGGKIGAKCAAAFGRSPAQIVREGLRRFKQLMETGEIPTTEGQPRGAR